MFLDLFLAQQRECVSVGGLLQRFLLVLNLRCVEGFAYGCPGVIGLGTDFRRLRLNVLVLLLVDALVQLDPGELTRRRLRGILWLRILLSDGFFGRLLDGSFFGIFLNPPVPA